MYEKIYLINSKETEEAVIIFITVGWRLAGNKKTCRFRINI